MDITDDTIAQFTNNPVVTPPDDKITMIDGLLVNKTDGSIIDIGSFEKGIAYSVLAAAVDNLYDDVRKTSWGAYRAVYDAVEISMNHPGIRRGRPKLGSTDKTYSETYQEFAIHTKRWSPSTIKKMHISYRAALRCFNNNHKLVSELSCEPSLIVPILTSHLADHKKTELINKACNGELRTIMECRGAVNKSGTFHSGNVKIYESTHWDPKYYDTRMGYEGYPDRIPGHIAYSVIYHFSEDDGVCYFPYFGSGTEGDAARMLMRPYLGWDSTFDPRTLERHTEEDPSTKERYERYFEHDSTKPWQVEDESSDLVFADAPNCFATRDPIYAANEIAMMANHANKALRVGGYFAITLKRPATISTQTIPFEDVAIKLHNSCFSKMFDLFTRITFSMPGGSKATGELGKLSNGYHDLFVYAKH